MKAIVFQHGNIWIGYHEHDPEKTVSDKSEEKCRQKLACIYQPKNLTFTYQLAFAEADSMWMCYDHNVASVKGYGDTPCQATEDWTRKFRETWHPKRINALFTNIRNNAQAISDIAKDVESANHFREVLHFIEDWYAGRLHDKT